MRMSPLLTAVAAGFLSFSAASAEEAPTAKAALTPTVVASVGSSESATPPAPATPLAAKDAAMPAKPRVAKRPLPPSLVVKIDLASQSMALHYAGARQETWKISSGREGYATPRGVFRPQWASKMWYSRKYDNAPMPHAVFFVGGVAVHGTQSTRLLGVPASHGCVRLAPGNAARFYSLVHKHGYGRTRIEVFGTPPASHIARRNAPSAARVATSAPRREAPARTASGSGPGLFDWLAPKPQYQVRPQPNAMIYVAPNSRYRGRETFVYNGVVYRRVR